MEKVSRIYTYYLLPKRLCLQAVIVCFPLRLQVPVADLKRDNPPTFCKWDM